MTTTISLVETPEDIAAVRDLCREFVAWQLDEFPDMREKILVYFAPEKWEKTLAALPDLHARPQGAMFLAHIEGQPVGCIMYQQANAGMAEIKRLFVSSKARGGGVASQLVTAVMEQAKADGYREMRLDTAKFLSGAINLYRKHGFLEESEGTDLPPEILDLAVFMRRTL